ncbi:MAG: hypothetical protein EZS28_021115 [Streblomastix strix]|uniref:Uncharacterized protein n=1 Tax=Streblomastix strix TaxID=222440 RepID=A0A5J4VLH9_9EUKA|nr:MAG: hypothetical protein EZS28_021115 [Streblomastix strix]
MIEAVATQKKDVFDSGKEIIVKTTIKMGKKLRKRKNILKTKERSFGSMIATRGWLKDKECQQRMGRG